MFRANARKIEGGATKIVASEVSQYCFRFFFRILVAPFFRAKQKGIHFLSQCPRSVLANQQMMKKCTLLIDRFTKMGERGAAPLKITVFHRRRAIFGQPRFPPNLVEPLVLPSRAGRGLDLVGASWRGGCPNSYFVTGRPTWAGP